MWSVKEREIWNITANELRKTKNKETLIIIE